MRKTLCIMGVPAKDSKEKKKRMAKEKKQY